MLIEKTQDAMLIEKTVNKASNPIPAGKNAILLSVKNPLDKPQEDLNKITELLNDEILYIRVSWDIK